MYRQSSRLKITNDIVYIDELRIFYSFPIYLTMDVEGYVDENCELISPFSSHIWADDELKLFLEDFSWSTNPITLTIEENVGYLLQ
jgi:hypothetical protein